MDMTPFKGPADDHIKQEVRQVRSVGSSNAEAADFQVEAGMMMMTEGGDVPPAPM